MIPNELIEKAWRAYVWNNNTQAIRNELAHPDLRGPTPPPPDTRQSMRSALEAVAADIWDEGNLAGCDRSENHDNPYRIEHTLTDPHLDEYDGADYVTPSLIDHDDGKETRSIGDHENPIPQA